MCHPFVLLSILLFSKPLPRAKLNGPKLVTSFDVKIFYELTTLTMMTFYKDELFLKKGKGFRKARSCFHVKH